MSNFQPSFLFIRIMKCIQLILHAKNSLVFTLTFILFLSVSTAIGQTKADFTGIWILNESKSQQGDGLGRRAATKMVITQNENSLTNERTFIRPNGEKVITEEKYNFDSETDNSTDSGKKKSTASWSNTMQELTVISTTVFERDGSTMVMKSTEVYKLSDNKQTVTVENTMSSQRGDHKTTLVYGLLK